MLRLINSIFYDAPTITPSGGGPSTGLDKESLVEFLKDDEPKDEVLDLTPKKTNDTKPKTETESEKNDDETEPEIDNEEEEDELEALVDDLKEPTDDQLELTTPVARRQILKKYPNLFKDFPYLEKAYYREQQFTEVFPTITEAKEAVEKVQTLDRFEKDLFSGNTETILSAVKEGDVNGFNKIVDDYLPALQRVDEKAYYHVISNLIKHTVKTMIDEAKRSNNENLEAAAEVLNHYAFGTTEITPATRMSKVESKDDSREQAISKKEQDFVNKQYNIAKNDLDTRVGNSIKSAIDSNIDPKGSMSDYVKRNAVREANESLDRLMKGDKRFKEIIDRLWENALKNDFSKDSLDRIRSAHVSKARTLLLPVIKRARNEALKGIGKRITEKDEDDSPSSDTDESPRKKDKPKSQERVGKIKEAKDIPKGMTTFDFLNSD
jgi:hypothetical protein